MGTERPYDLVLLGATGFTGRLVAAHLAGRTGGVSWAIAGRDHAALSTMVDELAPRSGGSRPAVEVVDVHDLVGLLDLAARTRVLATTVGPYRDHGELVAQACVRRGTHYADITGESSFVDLLRSRYDADAVRAGVKLVTCCGFESVPHDLGVRFTVGLLPDGAPMTVRAYVSAHGRMSGGTALTALGALADRTPRASRPDRAGAAAQRPVAALPARIHRVPDLGSWAVPLPTVDPKIVLRSAQVLDGYGTAFRYGHFAQVSRLSTAIAGVGATGLAAALSRVAPTRALLERLLPDPGQGPDEETRARSHFAVTFLGEAAGSRVVTRVRGGDPGYSETARMLGEAALTLAAEEVAPDVAGVVTPAVGLGAPYRGRLRSQGLVFEILAR
ncbi:MAG: saccharopine dehydrogenase NADP-binding domain-containing protein [Nitriliruptoraceae bacterium]